MSRAVCRHNHNTSTAQSRRRKKNSGVSEYAGCRLANRAWPPRLRCPAGEPDSCGAVYARRSRAFSSVIHPTKHPYLSDHRLFDFDFDGGFNFNFVSMRGRAEPRLNTCTSLLARSLALFISLSRMLANSAMKPTPRSRRGRCIHVTGAIVSRKTGDAYCSSQRRPGGSSCLQRSCGFNEVAGSHHHDLDPAKAPPI